MVTLANFRMVCNLDIFLLPVPQCTRARVILVCVFLLYQLVAVEVVAVVGVMVVVGAMVVVEGQGAMVVETAAEEIVQVPKVVAASEATSPFRSSSSSISISCNSISISISNSSRNDNDKVEEVAQATSPFRSSNHNHSDMVEEAVVVTEVKEAIRWPSLAMIGPIEIAPAGQIVAIATKVPVAPAVAAVGDGSKEEGGASKEEEEEEEEGGNKEGEEVGLCPPTNQPVFTPRHNPSILIRRITGLTCAQALPSAWKVLMTPRRPTP